MEHIFITTVNMNETYHRKNQSQNDFHDELFTGRNVQNATDCVDFASCVQNVLHACERPVCW